MDQSLQRKFKMFFGVLLFGFLCKYVLYTGYQLHLFEKGLNVISSPEKLKNPEFLQNSSFVCPIRRVSPMNKRKKFIRVGLLSYPGSGNTWTRHLIQQLTGFCAGTVYCGEYLQTHGIPGDCHPTNKKSRGCIIYKSHHSSIEHLKQFHKAVILIRNPFDALKAFFNWKFGKLSNSSGNQTSSRTQEARKTKRDPFHGVVDISRYQSTNWKEHVRKGCLKWEKSYTVWTAEFKNRFLLVRYRDLKNDLIPTLRRISEFLNVTASEKDLICTDINKEGEHHRKQKYELTVPDIFTEEQIDMVNTAIMNVMNATKNRYRLKDFIFVNSG